MARGEGVAGNRGAQALNARASGAEGRVVVFHSPSHARAALAAARELDKAVVLRTAPGAAGYAGALYLKRVVEEALKDYPEVRAEAVIDCGEDPGLVLGALRIGWRAVCFTGPAKVRRKLADIAAARGARLVRGRGKALDLLEWPEPAVACRRWLGSQGC